MTAPALPGLLATFAPYLGRYDVVPVGLLLLLESFGAPVPGEAVLIAASVYAGAGRLNLAVVAVIAVVAAVAGDSIGWLLGCHGGRRLLARFGRYVLLTPDRVARAERFFARHGSKIVPVARFVDGLRQANGIIAGMTRMPFRRFLVLNAIGAALWAGVWTAVGGLAAHHITTLYPLIVRFSGYELAAVAGLAAILAARTAVRHFTRSSADPRDPYVPPDPHVPELPDRKRDHAAFHRDLRLPGRVRADGGRVSLHSGAVRADHDSGRGARGRGGRRPPSEPDAGHRGRGGRQRGGQLHRLGGGPLRRAGRAAPLGRQGVAARARHRGGRTLVRPVRAPGRAPRPPAAGGADLHLPAGRHRRDAPAPIRGLHHDRLHPLDRRAGRGRVRGRRQLAADPQC